MSKAIAGKGTMTSAEYDMLRKTITEQFKIEIDAMTGPKPKLSKKQAADLLAGHDDGMRNLIMGLRAKGIVSIID